MFYSKLFVSMSRRELRFSANFFFCRQTRMEHTFGLLMCSRKMSHEYNLNQIDLIRRPYETHVRNRCVHFILFALLACVCVCLRFINAAFVSVSFAARLWHNE